MAAYQAFDVTKKVLITGAAGFIGFHLAKRLLEMGAVVLGFDNMNDYYDVSLKESRLGVLRAFSNFSFIKSITTIILALISTSSQEFSNNYSLESIF